jgi:hypothetical protein
MWPLKSNIPEIKTMTEDEDGNIEINHSHGEFKINRKDIVDVQFAKNFTCYLERRWKGRHFNPNNPKWDIFLELPIAFGIWNLCIYQNITGDWKNSHVMWQLSLFIPFQNSFGFSEFFLWIDIFYNLILFLLISHVCGKLILPLISYSDYIGSKNNVLKIKTVGNEFTYSFNDEFNLISFKELNNNETQSHYKNLSLFLFSIPIILFIFNWDEPFWFYQNRIFEANTKIDFPLSMTNYIDYFRGEPKGFFELFADGLASFGGTILFLIALLIALLIGIIFFCLTVLVFFGIPLIQFVIIPYLIFYFIFSLVDKNLSINGKELWKKFPHWKSDDIIIATIIFVFIAPILFFFRTIVASFPEKPHNLKNISFWIFCFLSAIIVGFGANFLMRDIIYSPLENLFLQVKDFCEPNKLGYSLFQLEKTIYISFILIISFLTFYLLIPKKRWESFKKWLEENDIDDDSIKLWYFCEYSIIKYKIIKNSKSQ